MSEMSLYRLGADWIVYRAHPVFFIHLKVNERAIMHRGVDGSDGRSGEDQEQ